jgi:hypothetical protein
LHPDDSEVLPTSPPGLPSGAVGLGYGLQDQSRLAVPECGGPRTRAQLGRREVIARNTTRRWARWLPPLVSAGLAAWVIWRVSPDKLTRAAALLDWPCLLAATAALVLALYLWDAVCLWWLFARPDRPLPFQAVLHARGSSYLLTAVNYEVGQAVLAWRLARAQGRPFGRVLATCVLLAGHDLAVLLALGLAGALLSGDPRTEAALWICGAGLGGLLGLALLARLVPRARPGRWAAWAGTWDWRRSAALVLLRTGYYSLLLLYAAVGLRLSGMGLDVRVVCGVVPLVLLADGLPISVSGLGTREAALLYLLSPEQPGRLLAFSLVWSAGLMLGRLALGLAHWWLLPEPPPATPAPPPHKESP